MAPHPRRSSTARLAGGLGSTRGSLSDVIRWRHVVAELADGCRHPRPGRRCLLGACVGADGPALSQITVDAPAPFDDVALAGPQRLVQCLIQEGGRMPPGLGSPRTQTVMART